MEARFSVFPTQPTHPIHTVYFHRFHAALEMEIELNNLQYSEDLDRATLVRNNNQTLM